MAYTNTDATSGMSGMMFWGIATVLILAWTIGFTKSFTMGGTLHLLLVAAVGMIAVRMMTTRPGR